MESMCSISSAKILLQLVERRKNRDSENVSILERKLCHQIEQYAINHSLQKDKFFKALDES